MGKVVCIGESIVDIIPNDGRFVLTAGGAPVNVCACVSALGGKAYFLGKISNDAYGVFLYDEIKKCGISTTYIKCDSEHKSAISFVSHKGGDRSFEFFRDNTADMFLNEDDVKDDMLEKGDVLHFCSVCLVDSPTKQAHKKAIALAKKKGAIVSFDLNMRPSLWTNDGDMIRAIVEFLPYADIIKLSSEELSILSQYLNCNKTETTADNETERQYETQDSIVKHTGKTHETQVNIDKCADKTTEIQIIQRIFDIAISCKLLILTKGGDGSTAYDRNLNCVSCDAVKTKVVDTTGAGDCFIGSLLYLISTNKFNLSIDQIQTALQFASSACAIEISSYGGARAMRHLKSLTF